MAKDNQENFVIGVDLGGTNIRAAAITREGKVIFKEKHSTLADSGQKDVIKRLITIINIIKEEVELKGNQVLGIGIGAPGIIFVDSGVVVTSPNLPDWKNVPLKSIVSEKFNFPVMLENDANAVAYGEKWAGAGKEVKNLVCVTLGTGVGGGLVCDGKIFQGADGMAGEIGHMTVEPKGLKCSCGNFGCLEAYASGTAIVKRIIKAVEEGENSIIAEEFKKFGTNVTTDSVFNCARKGDSLSISIIQEAGRYLGIGLANLINLLNPEMIVIGGGVMGGLDLFIDNVWGEIRKRAFSAPAERVSIVPARLGDNAGVIGAAGIMWQLLDAETFSVG